MKKKIHNIISVTLLGLLCPGVAYAEDWGGDYLRRPYVQNVLGADPATLTPGDPVLGTAPVILETNDNVIMWGKHRESSGKPDLSLEYNVDSNYLIPSDPGTADPAEDWSTVGSVYHYTYPIKYSGKDAVLSVRFLRKVEADEPTNIPFQSVYNVVFDVFVCRNNTDRAAKSEPDFTWRVDWDNDFVNTESTDCVDHPLMLCPIESKYFMCGYLTGGIGYYSTGDNTSTSARRRNDIFATTFDLVTFDTNTADGTEEVFLFADEYVWVFNLVDKKVECNHLKTCGTHFAGEETFPDTYKSEYTEHCGVSSDVDYIKSGAFSVEPITWGATKFSRPRCDDEDVEDVPDADLKGIFAIAHAAGDKYFGIWIPQGDTSRITFRFLGHKSYQYSYREQSSYTPPCYTTIDLVAHEVTPYNTVYCKSFDSSTSTPSNYLQDTNEKGHEPDDPVLLFAWTDYQYSSLKSDATPNINTSLLLLPTDTETISTSATEYSRNFSRFLNGGDFWTEYFSKTSSNNLTDFTAASTQTVLTHPEIGAFHPSTDVPSSMIFFNRHFFTYSEKTAGSSATILQYYYELSDKDGDPFGDDLFRVSGNPVVNDLPETGNQKLWFLAWIEDSSNQRGYDWQLFNVSCKWATTGDTKEIDGITGHALRLQPVIAWGGSAGVGNLSGAAAGIAPYPAPYPILKYKYSYANATNPTIIWSVAAPPFDQKDGNYWRQRAWSGSDYKGNEIVWSAPAWLLEASSDLKKSYGSLIQSKISLTPSTVSNKKVGFSYFGPDYFTDNTPYKDSYIGDTFAKHDNDAQVTFAYLPVDSHVYSIVKSDGTELGDVTISQLSQTATYNAETEETTYTDETYHYKQMELSEYEALTGGMTNVAKFTGIYSSTEGNPSSYVAVPRSYVIEQDENKDNYTKATDRADAVSNVHKYFTSDASNFIIGQHTLWDEVYDDTEFTTYPPSYSQTPGDGKSYASELHATADGVSWTATGSDGSSLTWGDATSTVDWAYNTYIMMHSNLKYNDKVKYSRLYMRPVWYLSQNNGQQWNTTNWMVLQEDESLVCNLSLLDNTGAKEDGKWVYGHHLCIQYAKSDGVEITNDSGLYRRLDGDQEWTKVQGGVTGNLPSTYHHLEFTDAERDAYMAKYPSLYAYYKVIGTYTTTNTSSVRMMTTDSSTEIPFESNEVAVFLFSYTTTGVDLVDANGRAVTGPIYDLLGRRVEGTPAPGLYITADGRKIRL